MNQAREQLKVKVFAKSGSLTFEEQVTSKKQPTIGIDGARATGHSTTAGNNYDWQDKITIQLSQRELPAVCAVLCGFRKDIELKNHGAERNKSIQMKNQEAGIYVVISQGQKGQVSVPVPNSDLFYVRALALRQLASAAGVSLGDTIELLRLYATEK